MDGFLELPGSYHTCPEYRKTKDMTSGVPVLFVEVE
jgi:hypothetical protein